MKNTTETQSTEVLVIEDVTKLEEILNQSGLETTDITEVKGNYLPFLQELHEIKKLSAKIDFENPTPLDEKIASDLRKRTVKVRTGSAEVKDKRKRIHLLKGNVEQASYNLIKANCELFEESLSQVENARKIAEQKRIDALRDERLAELTPLGYEHKPGIDLGTMDEALFAAVKSGLIAEQKRKEDEAKAAEAARIEAKRVQDLHDARKQILLDHWQFMTDEEKQISFGLLADDDFNTLLSTVQVRHGEFDAKQKEIEAENARLKVAADEQAKAEAAKGEIRRQRLQILKPYNYVHESDVAELTTEEFHTLTEKVASDYRAEQKRLNDEREAHEKKVAEDARIAAELKAKQDAEAKAEADRLAALEAEANKGDAEKFVSFMNDLKALTTKYTFTGKKYITLYDTCVELINKILTYGTDKTKK